MRKSLQQWQDWYLDHNTALLLIPIILSLLSAIVLGVTFMQTGEFIPRDVTLKGGISITVNHAADTDQLQQFLDEQFPEGSIHVRSLGSGVIIEASDVDADELVDRLESQILLEDYSVETMGSTLGSSFFRQMFAALFFAFILMGAVFHFYFRNIYATGAALFSAFMDLFITAGIMNLMGVRLTAGGIAAYLMLIGYSIDTSILLSTKLLKEQLPLREGLFGAMKTGLTMSAAGLAATGISFILTNNVTLQQIMLILIVGLLMDLITTWCGNVGLLRLYIKDEK